MQQFTSINPPKAGDKVILDYSPDPGPFTVDHVLKGVIHFKDRNPTWGLYDDTASSGCRLYVAATPQEPSKPMTKAVLDLLKAKGSLTSIEANGVLRCRALSKRVSELKELGWSISRVFAKDITGQRYARYHLETKAA